MLVIAGCGKSGPQFVPVEGQITFGGGPWPKPGIVQFHPAEGPQGQPMIPASADFTPDGNFQVTTVKPGDGLLVGKYRVTVECWEERPDMVSPGKNCYVPPPYRSATISPLMAEVPAGSKRVQLKLDVPPQ